MKESTGGNPSAYDPRVMSGKQVHAGLGIGGWLGGAGKAKRREREADEELKKVEDKKSRAEKVAIIGDQLKQFAKDFPDIYAAYKSTLEKLASLKSTKRKLLLKKKLTNSESKQLSNINAQIDAQGDALKGISARFAIDFDEVPMNYLNDIAETDGYKKLLKLIARRKDCTLVPINGEGENTLAGIKINIHEDEPKK